MSSGHAPLLKSRKLLHSKSRRFLGSKDPPCMLLLLGEKGVGKTTLGDHVMAQALADGFVIYEARPPVRGASRGYSLLFQLIEWFSTKPEQKPPPPNHEAWGVAGLGMDRNFAKNSSTTPLVLLPWGNANALQKARTILKGVSADKELGITEAQELFDTMMTVVTAETKLQRILLMVDNLQDLDGDSVNFLWFLCRNYRGENLRIVATALPKEGLPAPIRAVIEELLRLHTLEVQMIQRLDEGETYRLLESLPSGAYLTPAAKQYLYSASKGNPLTIIQLLQGILDTAGRDGKQKQQGRILGLLRRKNMPEVPANTFTQSGRSGNAPNNPPGTPANGNVGGVGIPHPTEVPKSERYYPAIAATPRSAPSTEPPPRASLLQEVLLKHGAKMVTLAGWSIPLHYVNSGIVPEYNASVNAVGMFDHSFYGILGIEGAGASTLLSKLTPTNVDRLEAGTCRSSLMLDDAGRLIDEITIICLARGPLPESFVVVTSPPTVAEVRDRLLRFRGEGTKVTDWGGQVALLSLAGPNVLEALSRARGWDITGLGTGQCRLYSSGATGTAGSLGSFFLHLGQERVVMCRSGRLQEQGVDIMVPASFAPQLWEALVAQACLPCGYGAGEILTLERGRISYSVPVRREHTPLESAMEGMLEMDHEFIGRTAVEKQNREGIATRLVGVLAEEHGAVPRAGAPLLVEEDPVGEVTVGGFSPRLDHGIALAYLPVAVSRAGHSLTLDLRPRKVTCRITGLPFL